MPLGTLPPGRVQHHDQHQPSLGFTSRHVIWRQARMCKTTCFMAPASAHVGSFSSLNSLNLLLTPALVSLLKPPAKQGGWHAHR